MGVYCATGDTIEGLSVDCVTRRWDWKGPKKHPLTGKRMTLYITDRNSEATVIKSIGEYDDPDLRQKTAHFHRTEGDTIKADAASVYIDRLTKITPVVKEGVTGRHGANIVHSTRHTIAEVRTPLDTMKKLLGMTPAPPLLKK